MVEMPGGVKDQRRAEFELFTGTKATTSARLHRFYTLIPFDHYLLPQNDKVEPRRDAVSSTLSFVLSSFSPLASVVFSLPSSLNAQVRCFPQLIRLVACPGRVPYHPAWRWVVVVTPGWLQRFSPSAPAHTWRRPARPGQTPGPRQTPRQPELCRTPG